MVNLDDVYMEIFLPSEDAARVKMGAEGRITVDYDTKRAVAGYVSFVSPEAQFTPKQVETRSEREKLMFRVKIQVPKEIASQYIEHVKTGVRGVGYVKTDPAAVWPARLQHLVGPTVSTHVGADDRVTAEISIDGRTRTVRAADPAAGAPVVSIRDVTHRYRKVVALDGISLDIPAGIMVGVVGPDGVGKSTLLALVAGSKKMQEGRVTVLGGDIARRAPPPRRRPAHRLHAAGAGQEPVPGAERLRQRRLHGAALRAARRRAPHAHSRAARRHRPRSVRGSPRRQAVGRHEAKGRAVRRAGPRPGSADPRRADHRRRPAVAAAVLAAHRHHSRGARRA